MKIRNKYLKQEIIDELNLLEDRYFTFDKPVPFKEGLTIYPVTVDHYNEFLSCSACCTLNKNDTAEGVGMTNLDYLISKMEDGQNGQIWAVQFSRLMELVFRITNGVRCNECNTVISFQEFAAMVEREREHAKCQHCGSIDMEEMIRYRVNPDNNRKEFVVNGVVVNSKDFDRLRQIIMYQNLPDYQDDSWVNPEIREDQRLKNELLSKNSSGVSATLEKKIVCVSAKSNYKIEELYNQPIRKFIMLLTAVDDALTYQSDRTGLMTGMVTMKKPLEHWIYKPEKSMYGEAVSAKEYVGKIESTGG